MATGDLFINHCLLQRKEYNIVYERKDKIKPIRPRPQPAPRRPQSCSSAVLLDCNLNTNRHSLSGSRPTLPTPEELVLRSAKSHPSVLIAIDTSINTFDRFAQNRASLRNLQVSRLIYENEAVISPKGLSEL